MTISNVRTVDQYVEDINKNLSVQKKAWINIAIIFLEAEEILGYDSKKFKEILALTGFSLSKAQKLVAIARDERLEKHKDRFDSVTAWTVLYEVTTLDDDQFEKLLSSVYEARSPMGDITAMPITTKLVNKIKRGDQEREVDAYQLVFSVKIDRNAIVSGKFESADYDQLFDRLREIQNEIPWVRIDEEDVFEKDAENFQNSYLANRERVLKDHTNKAIRGYVDRYKKRWNSPKSTRKILMESLGTDKDEIFSEFHEDAPNTADRLNYNMDAVSEANLHNEALIRVWDPREKRGEKANKPFAFKGRLDREGADLEEVREIVRSQKRSKKRDKSRFANLK